MLFGILAPSALGSQRHPFTDVPAHQNDSVQFLWERGIMVGTSSTQFSPNANLTRAMVATILYRVAGEPQATFSNVFADVHNGRWYSIPISWAHANNVVQGVTSTRFAPNDNLTNEQLAAMAYRYAVRLGLDVSVSSNIQTPANTSDWAVTYVRWAVSRGLFPLDDNWRIPTPNATATRGNTANFIHWFMSHYDIEENRPPQGGNIDELTRNGATWQQLRAQGFTRVEIQGAFEREMIRLVNNLRAEHGLYAFTANATIGNVARLRAEESWYHNSATHRSEATGLEFTEHFNAITGLNVLFAGENLAGGFDTPQITLNMWMGSPGHAAFILVGQPGCGWAWLDMTRVGVGFAFGDNGHFDTSRFMFWLATSDF